MLFVAMERDFQDNFRTGTAANQCPRFCTRRTARPARTRLEATTAIGWKGITIDFVRRSAAKPRVRAVFVVPLDNIGKFALKGIAAIRN